MQILNDRVRETANISTTSNIISYPAINLSIDRKSSTWKSTSNASQTITITWTDALEVNAVGLIHHNFDENTIFRVKYFGTASNVTASYDSGNIAIEYCFEPPMGFSTNSGKSFAYGGGNYFVHQTNTFSAQKIEITVHGGTPDGCYEIARIVAGNVISLEYGADSVSAELIDESERTRTESGDVLVNNAIIYKKLAYNLGYLSASNRADVLNIFRKIGTKYPVLWMSNGYRKDTIDKSLMIYGRLDSSSLDLLSKYISSTQLKITEY